MKAVQNVLHHTVCAWKNATVVKPRLINHGKQWNKITFDLNIVIELMKQEVDICAQVFYRSGGFSVSRAGLPLMGDIADTAV